MDILTIILWVFGALVTVVLLRLLYVWNTRVRPLKPSNDLEW